MKKRKNILLITILLTLFFSGCSELKTVSTDEPDHTELWVVTEQTTWDRMNGLTEVLIEQFEAEHLNVTIRLDILPTEEQERSVYLQQLRTQIMEGNSPDAYLLPTDGSLILDEPVQYTHLDVDLLFEDVELAMRNGLFYDISDLYDQDDTLGKEALYTQIMDVGKIEDARYVLPLRFDMPVIYGDTQALQDAGLDPEVLKNGIGEIIDAVTELDDPVLAFGALYDSYEAFGDLIDYESGEVLLDKQTLVTYLEQYRRMREMIGFEVLSNKELDAEMMARGATIVEELNLEAYINGLYDEDITFVIPATDGDGDVVIDELTGEEYVEIRIRYKLLPLYIGTIKDALDYASKAKYEQQELAMLPLRATNGDTVATVTYYAAVGSGCDNPELTYEFLRLFLLEESQWELNRPERSHAVGDKGRPLNTSNSLQYPGMIEAGWPVRVKGSVEHMWNIRRLQFYNRYTRGERMSIGISELEEERIPVLTADIDQVRFNSELSESLEAAIAMLNDPEREFAATDIDISGIAEDLLWELRWHTSEG